MIADTAARMERNDDLTERRSNPRKQAETLDKVRNFLDFARQLAADGTLSDRDIELLTKLAINQEIIPTLDVDSYGRAQADGSIDMADWADDQEERDAGHVSRRVAAIAGVTRMIFDEVPPKEVLAWLSDHIEVPEGDDDAARVTALADLALHPQKHVELRARGDTGQSAQDQSDLDAYLGERYGWRGEGGRRKTKAKTPAPAGFRGAAR